jgi:delta-1-pyrroline-5-carboxylate synthetase
VDAKTDYPAACNAVEKILVHVAHQQNGNIFQLQKALQSAGVEIYGTEATTVLLGVAEAPSLRHEYGTLEVTLDVVEDMTEAIEKIHTLGSGHTEVCEIVVRFAYRLAALFRIYYCLCNSWVLICIGLCNSWVLTSS